MHNDQEFKLERYKYILAQKRSLNSKTFKVVAIYQALIGALGLAQFNVMSMLHKKSISLEIAFFSSQCLLVMLVVLTTFILFLLVGGIFSWLNYRDDEKEIEMEVFGKSRGVLSLKSIFWWYETYIIVIVILMLSLAIWVYINKIFPFLDFIAR